MNGLKYYRIKRGFTQKELAAHSGISHINLAKMERMSRNNAKGCLCEEYVRVSNFLGVKIDELLREDLPEQEDGVLIRNLRPCKREVSSNCLTAYRLSHRMTLRDMAKVLDVSYETVRLVCLSPETPHKYIDRLSELEGISSGEFVRRYGGN